LYVVNEIINLKNKIMLLKKMCLMFAIIMVAFFTTNCKKDQSSTNSASLGTLQFKINSVTQNGLKSALTDSVVCNDTLTPAYAVFKLDNGPFDTIPISLIGSYYWTNTIKLSSGTHTINEFLVYSSHHFGDVLLWATPHTGSPWAGYVTTPLNHQFTVTTDQKISTTIDVVCFQPSTYQDFGFTYFKLNPLVISQQWFFGDFCIFDASQYAGSDYTHQANWVNSGYIDAPAIFRIDVLRNGVLQNSFTNDDALHQYGNKVSVTYGHYIDQTDLFSFNLYILVRQGTQFNFVLFNTWSFTNVSNIPKGSDHITDFILGSCYDPGNPPQLVLPTYLNIPTTATYTIGNTYAPGTLGGYVDATLTSIGNGYIITNTMYASNCADHQTNINIGQAYNMNVYSSLYPNLLPPFAQQDLGKWNKINWVYNHLSWYPGHHWYDIQQLVWLYDQVPWNGQAYDGVPALTPMAQQMYADANANGANYVPPIGGFAALIFIQVGTPPNMPEIQTMFIQLNQ